MLIDVMVGVFVLVTAVISYGALIPVVQRGQEISRDEEVARQIVQRTLEHIQMLRPNNLNKKTLEDLHLIERNQLSYPYRFGSMPLDQDSYYSADRQLQDAFGTIGIQTLSDGSKLVLVRLSYKSPSGQKKTIKSGTVIGAFR